jgi:hypothetical protein
LNEICNLDKHRRIPLDRSEYELFVKGPPPCEVTVTRTDDCQTISVPIAFKSYLEFYKCSPVSIKFGGDSSGISEDFAGLIEIHDFIRDSVLPRFEMFFL